ncbi:CAP-Gly domain-containing linker protein 1 isoform X4 [Procambarus clarkii]|uniref:CAP-Gly domain-containing linker protein 1 isoform X4 n=1 Tax=Procambarus clarkii TaxID=6728 RepID=UPI001E673452|nr:CAP-Gly domain-containing linker protein 1-like isoform X4 [Procambarus clarkii]
MVGPSVAPSPDDGALSGTPRLTGASWLQSTVGATPDNGERVDAEVEKLRRLSQELARKEEFYLLNRTTSPKSWWPSPRHLSFSKDNTYIYNNNNDVLPSNNNLLNHFNALKSVDHPVSLHYKRAKSPLRDNGTFPCEVHGRKAAPEQTFLANTLPDLPSYKMPSQRRFSDEVNFRRPLATLHEDQVVARRRFSEDVRKKSLDTSGVLDDLHKQHRRLSEAGVRRLSDASIVLTEDTDSFIIGDRVWVGGTKGGVISYIGDTQFAPGEWAGVTLDEPIGKNDGSVAGIRYFQCEAKKGVFSRLTRLSRSHLTDQDIEILTSRSSSVGAESPKSNGTPATSVASGPTTTTRKITPSSAPTSAKPSATAASVKSVSPAPASTPKKTSSSGPVSSSSDPKVGDRVVITSAVGSRHGTLRFIGKTDFADGIWAGVELEEPTGKNDGSVAGKKYFECKDKYGLFAPIARVGKCAGSAASPRRTSVVPQTPRPTIRRSNSRESLGGSSVASSTASSVRGTRVRLGVTSLTPGQRPTRIATSSVPSTKALQEALAEKTQHVDQLMRERDVERAEVARMAAQADEATRAAHDMRLQLDQLQEESEERLHDFGERIRNLEKEREDFIAKLEDKQRELDDLAFRLEEESITKADLESLALLESSQSTTDGEKMKGMEKELEEARRKLKERGTMEANKAFEMEELEINLRASVEELQARIMEMEGDKESLENVLSKQSEQLKVLETNAEALRNDINEREQKIKLLESSKEEDQARSKERSLEITEKDTRIRELQLELDKTSKEVNTASHQLEEMSNKFANEKSEKDSLLKEILGIREQLNSGSSETSTLMGEISKLKEELREATRHHQQAAEKITLLECQKSKLEAELENANSVVSSVDGKLTQAMSSLKLKEEQLQNLMERLQKTELCLKEEQETRVIEKQTAEKQHLQKEEEHIQKIKIFEEKTKDLESRIAAKEAEINESNRQLTKVESKIAALEVERVQLKEQVAAYLSSSSGSSEQLATLKNQLQEKDKQIENVQVSLQEKIAALSQEQAARAGDNDTARQQLQQVKEKYEKELDEMKKNLLNLEKEIGAKVEEILNLKKQHIAEQEELVKKKDLELYELQEQVMLKDGELSELEDKIKCLESQVDAMTCASADKVGSMEKALGDVRVEKERLLREIEEVLKSKVELEQQLSALDKENRKLRTEQEENLLAVTQKDQKVAALKAEVEHLMTTFNAHREDVQKQLVDAQADKEAMAHIHKTFEKELVRLNCLQESLSASEEEKNTLQTHINQLQEELSRLKGIEEENMNLAKEKDKLQVELQKIKVLETENLSLLNERNKLEDDHREMIEDLRKQKDELLEEKCKMEEEIRSLRKCEEERSRLGGDVQRLEAELTKMMQIQESNTTLTSQLEKLKAEKAELVSSTKVKEEQLILKKQLEEDNIRLNSSIKSCTEEKNKLMIDIQRLEAETACRLKDIESEYNRVKDTVQVLQEEKKMREEEKEILKEEIKKLRLVEEEKKDLESKNIVLTQGMEELKQSHEGRIGEFEVEKFNLVEEVVSLQDQLSVLKTEMVETTRKMEEANAAAEAAGILRAKINLLETEKRRLESKIVDLRVQVASTEISNNDSDSFIKQIKEEKDQFEGQVNFLNTVIVDMQRKNDELRTRIEIFELGNVSDDTKANMNGISHLVAPRMYCDICDCFDAHDTEDCPKQASSDSPPPSLHHGQRGTIRPYCDTCEVFGHETGECSDETF